MDRRILVPVDGSEQSQVACDLACGLFPDGELFVLHVINPAEAGFRPEAAIPSFPSHWYDQEQSKAESIFEDLEDEVRHDTVEMNRRVEVGKPAETIVQVAKRENADHIVMGSAGRQGVSRLLLGSVAEGVIRRSPVPVTVAP